MSTPNEKETDTSKEATAAASADTPAEGEKKSFKDKFRDFVSEYGAIGIITWFSIFGLTIVGFAIAFQFGLDVGRDAADAPSDGSAVESGGVWLAAYLASQATKPLRIIATFALTPILARTWKRLRGQDPEADADEASADDAPADNEKA